MDTLSAMCGRPEDGTNKGSGLWSDTDYRPVTNYVGTIDDLTTAKTFASARTTDMNNIVAAAPDRREMPYVIAACRAAMEAMSCNSNAATKFEGLSLYPAIDGPVDSDNDWTSGENGSNNIVDALGSGLAVVKTDADGNSVLHDTVTTYRPDSVANPVWQYEINKNKVWNVAKTLIDDKVVFEDDVMVESKAEASDQPLAVDADTMKARVAFLVENVWIKYGLIYNKEFTLTNMVVTEGDGGDPDRFDRYIPIIPSGNRRVTSDNVLVDRNTSIAGLAVNVG